MLLDDGLVALGATVVSLLITLPLLIKWWPRAKTPGAKPAATSAASKTARQVRPAASAQRPQRAPVRRVQPSAGARPRR